MPLIKTTGLVIQHTNIGEYDRMLSILSPTLGMIQVSAKGARSMKAGLHNATRCFCYAEFILYPAKKEIYSLKSAAPLQVFLELAEDLDRLETATEIAKFARYLCISADYAKPMLRLVLGSFHLLCHDANPKQVQLTFLLKAAQTAGFTPDFSTCARCGSTDALVWFDTENGTCLCSGCATKKNLSPSLLAMFQYILNTPVQRCFAYRAESALLAAADPLLFAFIRQHIGYFGNAKKGRR